jgi:hypothetical protein
MLRAGTYAVVALLLLASPARADDNGDDDFSDVEELSAAEVKPVADDDDPSRWWDESNPAFDRVVSLPRPTVPRKYSLRFTVDHRANQPVNEDPFDDFFGFEGGGLKVGLGLRFTVLDHLDLGVYRLSNGTERFDLYQTDVKYQALEQAAHGADLALRVGFTRFAQEDAEDAIGGLAQLLVGRRFFDRLVLGTGLLYHSESTNQVKSNLDDDWSLAVMGTASVRIRREVSWEFEVAYGVAGYRTRGKEGIDAWPVMSTSFLFSTHRHTFSFVLSNTPYTSADGYICNSPRGLGDLVAGFAITREWNFE